MTPAAAPNDFYARLLAPEEQELIAQAPVTADLQSEIAFLRARLATLIRATSPSASRSSQNSAQLARVMELLTRAVAVQSRLGAADNTLAEINEFIRRKVMADPESALLPTPDSRLLPPTP